jgi:hypothetical protein
VPAEHAYLELGAEHLWPQILDRAGLAIGAIVEKGGEPSARSLKHLFRRGTNRLGLGIIEIEALDADLVANLAMSCGFRAVANTRQPRAFISRAEARPMPDEQPVMRIDCAVNGHRPTAREFPLAAWPSA